MSKHHPIWQKADRSRVQSLRDLPQQMQPARDLWPQIAARLAETDLTLTQPPEETRDGAPEALQPAALPQLQRRDARTPMFSGWRVRLAAAVGVLALGAALTTGVWLRYLRAADGRLMPDAQLARLISPQIQPLDARGRAALLRSLDARLQSLPAPSRQKVLADLNVIEQSMQDIQSALGRDPGNVLLREMLLETYQDEQHLIATVQEAGMWTEEADSGRGST